MPGRAPTITPITEQRNTSHLCWNTSFTPCHMPERTSYFTVELIAVRLIARSASSGRAKMPSVSGNSGRPS